MLIRNCSESSDIEKSIGKNKSSANQERHMKILFLNHLLCYHKKPVVVTEEFSSVQYLANSRQFGNFGLGCEMSAKSFSGEKWGVA